MRPMFNFQFDQVRPSPVKPRSVPHAEPCPSPCATSAPSPHPFLRFSVGPDQRLATGSSPDPDVIVAPRGGSASSGGRLSSRPGPWGSRGASARHLGGAPGSRPDCTAETTRRRCSDLPPFRGRAVRFSWLGSSSAGRASLQQIINYRHHSLRGGLLHLPFIPHHRDAPRVVSTCCACMQASIRV